jgi:hypothetical protein
MANLPTAGMQRSDEDGWRFILERHDDEPEGPLFVVVDKHGNEDVLDARQIGDGWEPI